MSANEPQHVETKKLGHEPIGVSVRFVTLGTIGLIVLIVCTLLAMGGLSRWLGSSQDSVDNTPLESPARTVGFEPNQVRERESLQETQREWLDEYAWLDDSEQMARIPIDRAIEMVAERGLGIVSRTSADAESEQAAEAEGDEQ